MVFLLILKPMNERFDASDFRRISPFDLHICFHIPMRDGVFFQSEEDSIDLCGKKFSSQTVQNEFLSACDRLRFGWQTNCLLDFSNARFQIPNLGCKMRDRVGKGTLVSHVFP